MNSDDFLRWIERSLYKRRQFKTLGGRAKFYATYNANNKSVAIENSKQKKYTLEKKAIEKLFQRFDNAPANKKYRGVYYSDPEYPETPNRVFAPYLPAIIKYWVENIAFNFKDSIKNIKYYEPNNLYQFVESDMNSIPSVKLFNDPKYQKLIDKWCAASFGVGYKNNIRPCEIGINESIYQVDADFFLKVDKTIFPFQTTEVFKENRKRGLEFKEIEAGTTKTFPYRPPEEGMKGPGWIKNAIEKKIRKEYLDAINLNLLLYVNFLTIDLKYQNIIETIKEFENKFYSIWSITDTHICSLFSKSDLGEISQWQTINR